VAHAEIVRYEIVDTNRSRRFRLQIYLRLHFQVQCLCSFSACIGFYAFFPRRHEWANARIVSQNIKLESIFEREKRERAWALRLFI